MDAVASGGGWPSAQLKLAAVYQFDYRIAYLVPPMLMLGVSWFLFRKRRG